MTDASLTPWLTAWDLQFEGRPDRGGRPPYPGVGDVAFVRRENQRLVLKLLPEGSDEYGSAAVLRHWNGVGAIRVIAAGPGAVLLERALPGEDLVPLVRAGDDDVATHVLCDVMAKLNRPSPSHLSLRTVEDWGRGFARNRAAAAAVGMPAELIVRGEAMFRELCGSQAEAIVLHGDLQHFNVIRDDSRGWLAIDPKGVLGEPAYETGAMLRNPVVEPDLSADAAIVARRCDILCERLGFERQRVLAWCFSQWVLSILWAIEDRLPFAPTWLRGPLVLLSLL